MRIKPSTCCAFIHFIAMTGRLDTTRIGRSITNFWILSECGIIDSTLTKRRNSAVTAIADC